MLKQSILTKMEQEVINRRLNNQKLTKQDSYYLSVSIRPKLRQMEELSKKNILKRIEYVPKAKGIENKIIELIKSNIKELDSIILYGSVVQTNYSEYNDIDIIIVTKKKLYKTEMEKWRKIAEIQNILKSKGLVSDIEIISKDNLLNSYKNSPTLIYQLKDHKIIYGKIKIPNKIELYKIHLQMKLDWSEVEDNKNDNEIYSALRNTLLVRLLFNKIIDNNKLKESLNDELGKNLIERLKNNQASEEERIYALHYLKYLLEKTEKEIGNGRWEKIEL